MTFCVPLFLFSSAAAIISLHCANCKQRAPYYDVAGDRKRDGSKRHDTLTSDAGHVRVSRERNAAVGCLYSSCCLNWGALYQETEIDILVFEEILDSICLTISSNATFASACSPRQVAIPAVSVLYLSVKPSAYLPLFV